MRSSRAGFGYAHRVAGPSKTRIAELTVDVYEPQDGAPRGKLLFCHGAWVGGWIWEQFAAWFASQGYTCYAPTWRGHYDSRPVGDVGALSVYDYVEDALSVARSVAPDAVVGESMGGLIAQKVAESSDSLRALVLMNSVPPFRIPASWKVLRSQVRYLGDLIGRKPNLPQEADYKALILNNVPEPEASQFYARICPDAGRALLEMSLGKIKVDPNRVRCPVHVIVGHLDAVLPPKVHRKLATLYGADIVEYPAMSHHTFSEEGWETVAAELLLWLDEKLGARVG